MLFVLATIILLINTFIISCIDNKKLLLLIGALYVIGYIILF